MIPVRDLSAEDRNRVRDSFVARMKYAKTPEWRKLWETEVLFLDGRSDEAVAQLRDLVGAGHQEIAVAALMSLGEWYEQTGAATLAQQAYTAVIDTPGLTTPILAKVKLAGLHNRAHEPARAAAVLQSAAASITNVPADDVQFVVAEYCQSLRDLGRVDEARMFIRHAITSFPDRAELPLLEQHLLGAAD